VASIPVLLTPSNYGTVSTLPYFEMFAVYSNASAEINFEFEIVDVVTGLTVVSISSDDSGWSKDSYSSGEIAVYSLSTEHELLNTKQYKWRARSSDGSTWSLYTEYFYFNVLQYRGDSDIGVFTVSIDALDAMKPHLISVGDSYPPGSTNTGNGAVITNRSPVLKWSVPYGLGEGIHFRVEIDVTDTFTSRNILRYESKYDPDFFEMFDGIGWYKFPGTGTTFGMTQVRITLPDTFFNDKYYWKVIPAI